MNDDDRVVYQGTAQYVKAITALQICLRDPRLVYEDELLAVCLLLSAYEVRQPSTILVIPANVLAVDQRHREITDSVDKSFGWSEQARLAQGSRTSPAWSCARDLLALPS